MRSLPERWIHTWHHSDVTLAGLLYIDLWYVHTKFTRSVFGVHYVASRYMQDLSIVNLPNSIDSPNIKMVYSQQRLWYIVSLKDLTAIISSCESLANRKGQFRVALPHVISATYRTTA